MCIILFLVQYSRCANGWSDGPSHVQRPGIAALHALLRGHDDLLMDTHVSRDSHGKPQQLRRVRKASAIDSSP